MSRQKVVALVEQTGGELIDEDYGHLVAWSGRGLIWRATGEHSCSLIFFSDKAHAWRLLLDDLAKGTDPCEIVDCEGCEEA